ncbi:MAG TPA: hypothetical protein VEJ63_02700 [Planctomycetota bacterium]|nr:hypothetical protein [Planctomycetota bacterium]
MRLRIMGGLSVVLACICLSFSVRATDILQTIAGGGSLELYKPLEANLLLGNSGGLAVSAIGEIYVSDSGHHQVLKIDPTTGRIVIFAGNGTAAFFGDGGPAVSAGLNTPGALALDGSNNLFIVDVGNFCVRRVDALTGIITTVAGTGTVNTGSTATALLGDNGPATTATFGPNMGGIAINGSGAIFVSDAGNDVVRTFTVGGNISTAAGVPGTAGFVDGPVATALLDTPTGLAFDAAGNLYIGDSGNRRVRKLAAGALSTVAGNGSGGFSGDGGAATSANLGTVGGLAIDANGNLLIAATSSNRIRRVDVGSATPNIVTIAGDGGIAIGDLGPATAGNLNAPTDVKLDSKGNIYIYDSNHNRIRRVDTATGFIDTILGTGLVGFVGDRGPQSQGILVFPTSAAFDAAGNLYIADTGNNSVRRVAPDGTLITFAGNGVTNGLGDLGPANLASLDTPLDVAVSGSVLFIADNGHGRIRAVDLTTGVITTHVQISNPVAIIVEPGGTLLVAHDNQVDRVNADKTITPVAGNTPATADPLLGDGQAASNAVLSGPSALALNANGDLFIADTGNNRVRLISGGLVSTFAGGGNPASAEGDGGPATAARLRQPSGVTLSASGTALIISDTNNHRIRSVDLGTNVITTIAGTGVAGFSGDGDAAVNAQVNFPARIFVNNGALVFADTNNNRIRKIVTATDLAASALALGVKLTFSVDKKTGQMVFGKDSVALKAALPLPAGIAAANLKITVDIVDLHQQVQLDANGKQPKVAKAAKTKVVPTVFDFNLPAVPPPPVSKFALAIKGTSDGAKPVGFSFSSKGTFREELGRAGFTNTTITATLPVRVNITVGTVTFTGVVQVVYKATQGKSGSGKSVKAK